MKQFVSSGIILSRTDFGEADRIITFLTPDHGKVRAIAKGVRKAKSKLAGGIELFSTSHLTLIVGRGEINTLISTRLIKHYGDIVKDLERTNTGYELIKILNKATEDHPEEAYFKLLQQSFEALNNQAVDPQITELWFKMQLLRHGGHSPDLRTDKSGKGLQRGKTYRFQLENMQFVPATHGNGGFSSIQIQFLRLGFSNNLPKILQRVENVEPLVKACQPLVQAMLAAHVRI